MPTEPPEPLSSDPSAQPQPPPEIEQPGDRVPHLRADLQILPREGEAGLFDVCLAEEGARAFTLYDIEVSVARMLDGRRTAAQLIEAAGKIGIPVTVDSLRKFVRQLRAYRFVDEGAGSDEASPWAPRTQWRPEVRELFQSALRTYRNDRPTEARGYLEALFQIEPEIPEAHELMQRIEERILSAEAPPLPNFDALHTEEVDLSDLEGELGEDPAPRVSEDAYDEETEFDARPKRRWPLVALVVATGVMAGVMAIPVPTHVSASAELIAAGTPHTLTAPRSGRIAELLVTPGKWVKSGEKLLTLDASELDARQQVLQDDLASLQQRMDRLTRRAESSSARKAKAAVEKQRAQAEKLQKQRDALAKRKDSRSRRKLAKLEKSLAKKQHQIVSLQASYERKIGTKELAALDAEKTAKQGELAKIDEQRTRSILVATGDGDFEPTRRVGDPVIAGETIAKLLDARKLKVSIGVPARQATLVKEGQPVSIRLAGTDHLLKATILSTSGESAGPGLVRATAAVENADLKLAPGTNGLAEIDCGTDRLYTLLTGKK